MIIGALVLNVVIAVSARALITSWEWRFLENIRVLSSAHTPLLTEWRNNSPEHSGHPPHISSQEHLIAHGWAPEAHHFSHTVHTEKGNDGIEKIAKAHKFVHAWSCINYLRLVATGFSCCICNACVWQRNEALNKPQKQNTKRWRMDVFINLAWFWSLKFW